VFPPSLVVRQVLEVKSPRLVDSPQLPSCLGHRGLGFFSLCICFHMVSPPPHLLDLRCPPRICFPPMKGIDGLIRVHFQVHSAPCTTSYLHLDISHGDKTYMHPDLTFTPGYTMYFTNCLLNEPSLYTLAGSKG